MTSPVPTMLDGSPTEEGHRRRSWLEDVERSLRRQPEAWLEAVGPVVREHGLAKHRAEALLWWVEETASRIVTERRSKLVELAAFAMSLLEASPLDRRDVMVVATVVRRASALAGLPYSRSVRRGCSQAGALGTSCERWLTQITDDISSSYEEVGSGRSVEFRRRPSTIDVARLERKFGRSSEERGE